MKLFKGGKAIGKGTLDPSTKSQNIFIVEIPPSNKSGFIISVILPNSIVSTTEAVLCINDTMNTIN